MNRSLVSANFDCQTTIEQGRLLPFIHAWIFTYIPTTSFPAGST